MKTEQVNLRLEADLIAAIEYAAQVESLDRGTMIRKLLKRALSQWRLDHALHQYQLGEISIGRAAQDAGVSHWDIMEESERRGIAYRFDVEEALEALPPRVQRVAESSPGYQTAGDRAEKHIETLPDRPPRPGKVLLVGINPPPVSVRSGHYYQGRLGKRLWQRLTRLGLLAHPTPGAEDDAFVRAGHGLTDVVKRSTRSASELSREEIREGVEGLREKVKAWQPGLILFAFKEAARAVTGSSRLIAGKGPPCEGVPTFVLSSPYAAHEEAERIDEELRSMLTVHSGHAIAHAATQAITPSDISSGIIRLPKEAKSLFPETPGQVRIILRGKRLAARYDPRIEPDRERSGVLRVGREVLSKLVKPHERLRVSRTADGVLNLD